MSLTAIRIDTNHWRFEMGNHGGWGNGEMEYYTSRPDNAYESNGVLHIVAAAGKHQRFCLYFGPG